MKNVMEGLKRGRQGRGGGRGGEGICSKMLRMIISRCNNQPEMSVLKQGVHCIYDICKDRV